LALTAGDGLLKKSLSDVAVLGGTVVSQVKVSSLTWNLASGQNVPPWVQLNGNGDFNVLVPSSVESGTVAAVEGVDADGTKVVGNVVVGVTPLRKPEDGLALKWSTVRPDGARVLGGTAGAVVEPGAKVELTLLDVTLAGKYQYQWRKDGVRIDGGTASALLLTVSGLPRWPL
jgi:hypothetical protein